MTDCQITLVGNVSRPPELRYAGDRPVAGFGLAVNRRWQNRQSQEWEEAVSFFDVTVWGSLAENVAESVDKGCRVMVSGRVEQESWEDRTSGEKRSRLKVVADEVGPSLRWATCDVIRNERREGQPARNGGGGSGGGRRQAPAGDYGEEPFVSLHPDDLWRAF